MVQLKIKYSVFQAPTFIKILIYDHTTKFGSIQSIGRIPSYRTKGSLHNKLTKRWSGASKIILFKFQLIINPVNVIVKLIIYLWKQ